MRRALLILLLTPAPVGPARAAEPGSPPVTVAFELVVLDAKGQPIEDLRLDEVEVVQDAEKQKIRTLEKGRGPGHYEISYVPFSGKPGGVTVRVTRRGSLARGPNGPRLEPRVIAALSPLESELTAALEAAAGRSDLACQVAVLRFEPTPKGVRHAVAVEIPLSELRYTEDPTGHRGRLQVLARIQSADDPAARQHVTLDRIVETHAPQSTLQRLVWTGTVVVPPGRHTIDVLVRDPIADRATTRTLPLEVRAPAAALGMSSVVLLQPRGFFFMRDEEKDDPLVYQGTALMPRLQTLVHPNVAGGVRFFVALYPAAGRSGPVTLAAEVFRDGTKVGEASVPLPAPEPSGEIRYVGALVTRSFPPGSYALRLLARQAGAEASSEAPFALSADALLPVRVEPAR